MSLRPLNSRDDLRSNLAQIVSFLHPRCVDAAGGYFGFFREDGSVHQGSTKHLVSTARAIINYSSAFLEFRKAEYRQAVRHGIDFLRRGHRNAQTGGYAWVVRDGQVLDATNHCYGLAFVMLAYAKAVRAGVSEAHPHLYETWEVLEKRFWEHPVGLYADEASADWVISEYRGQNANMHLCEAFLAAFDATQDAVFLRRAEVLADNMVNRQATLCGGQIWEHYKSDWQIDWDFNKGDRTNIFRPWGIQPGHQVEWAKLLIHLDRYVPEPWKRQRAVELFDCSVARGWDACHGGLIYGYDPDGAAYDSDKYSWVQIEAMATAALLLMLTGEERFGDWYAKLAEYCSRVFVDAQTGCWHRIRKPDNSPYPEPAPFSCLTEYHTFSAFTDIAIAMQAINLRRAASL